MLEVSQNVTSTLERTPLLNLILEQLEIVAKYDGAAISIVEGKELVVAAYRGVIPKEQVVGIRRPLRREDTIWQHLKEREFVLVDNIQDDTPLAQAYRRHFETESLSQAFQEPASVLMVALVARERVIGFLGLYRSQPGYYSEHQARLVLTIANQAAAAIENARLYEQAQSLAALEERQRLARELHDSVSQALYGIALGTRTARTLFQRNETGVAEVLDYVASLAAAGMAEIRALIFELRPESLETEGLVAAVTKQAAALQARHRIVVETELPIEPEVPIAVKEVLYRVAQEALHNTVKHAQARCVQLALRQTAEGTVLDVRDDGVGFDPNGSFPGHLGLKSMHERTARLGGTFAIDSAPGKGTSIRVVVPHCPDHR
ncbi:MAG: GAF domain-containing sensor histidine kinase [Ardenticatenaceae bacterium]|nr:GAF domain-containing sensor histidine kinase [Ardenticatenaceae bacterium]